MWTYFNRRQIKQELWVDFFDIDNDYNKYYFYLYVYKFLFKTSTPLHFAVSVYALVGLGSNINLSSECLFDTNCARLLNRSILFWMISLKTPPLRSRSTYILGCLT